MADSDFQPRVGEPLDRDVVRSQATGYLVSCQDGRCQWMGVFPDQSQATSALEAHITHQRQSGSYHYGTHDWSLLELVDDRTARFIDGNAGLGGHRPLQRDIDDQRMWRRSTDDGVTVADLCYRGLHFKNTGYGEGIAVRVSETRSAGLPTYTIVYVLPGVEPNDDGAYSESLYKWKNQLVAQDGEVYSVHLGDGPVLERRGPGDGEQLGLDAISSGRS